MQKMQKIVGCDKFNGDLFIVLNCATQVDGEIFYEACKDIPEGTEMLVWYGDMYMQFMGIPICLKDTQDNRNHVDQNSKGIT